MDQGEALGLHGSISNTAAEDICIKQGWDDDEYKIFVRGMMREARAMTEWKMTRQGFYALGLEPGTAVPLGRAALSSTTDAIYH